MFPPAWINSDGILSMPGETKLFNFSIAISTSKELGSVLMAQLHVFQAAYRNPWFPLFEDIVVRQCPQITFVQK
jgi:hypothetical protein